MDTFRLRLVLAAGLVCCLATAGCTAPLADGDLEIRPEVAVSTKRYRKEYVLAPSDGLEVVLLRHPEVSRSVQIRPDGFISLPMLDDVRAAGKTPRELDAELTERFSERLKDPEVTVIATSVRPPMVYVFGEVERQLAVELRSAATAAQAVAQAGGFRKSAATDSVAIIRLMEDGRLRALKVNVDLGGQPAAYMALHNVALQPDDLVFVPETGISQFDRWVDNWVNTPLSGINSVLNTVLIPYILIQEVDSF